MTKIRLIDSGWPVSELVEQIEANPSVWNRQRARTTIYNGPHNTLSDIWVRYNDFKNFTDLRQFNEEHESVWYPVAGEIPAAKELAMAMMSFVGGTRLGGVLITKIPPHDTCRPHIDGGWHSRYYEKFGVQLKANEKQAFCFEGERLVTQPGDVFTFDNSYLHWVTNDSDEDRMTLIICINRS